MAYIEGEERGQHTFFPTTLEEMIPQDHHIRRVNRSICGPAGHGEAGFHSLRSG